MSLIDTHSHVLPMMDDGAESVSTSVDIIKKYKEQSIHTIICTPHFYRSDYKTVREFIEKRQHSYELLKAELVKQDITNIELILGCEVHFDCDLSEIEDIDLLKLGNTDYMLIEMPFITWEDWIFDYLFTLISKKNIIPIIAHAERYVQSEKAYDKLDDLDVCYQINSSSFLESGYKKNAIKLLKDNRVHIIGTDAHNLSSRPPQLLKALDALCRKKSRSFVDTLIDNAYSILDNEEIEKHSQRSSQVKRKKSLFRFF